MNKDQILNTIIDFVLAGVTLLAIKYEPVISKYEEKTFYKVIDKISSLKIFSRK